MNLRDAHSGESAVSEPRIELGARSQLSPSRIQWDGDEHVQISRRVTSPEGDENTAGRLGLHSDTIGPALSFV